MTKQTKLYIGIAVGVLALGGVGAAVAYDQVCVDPEAQMLRLFKWQGGEKTPEGQEKLKGLPIFEKLEKEWCGRQNMSKEERDRIVEEKKRGELEREREREKEGQEGKLEPRRLLESELGIQPYPIDFVPPENAYLQPTNTWLGYQGDTLISITGTAKSDDPKQGAIYVMENGQIVGGKVYLTPTATGPVKVVFENGGVVTLQSTGAATYSFDLKTMSFK
jgi:hypothetical protein